MLRTCFFTFVLVLVMLSTVMAQSNGESTDREFRNHHIALKASSISHTGFFYGYHTEQWMIGGGGYYFFESEGGNVDSVFEFGFELQRSLKRSGGFNLYAITGFGIHREQGEFNADDKWFQYGFGVGVSNESSSGFIINLDGGILRFRNYSGGSNNRTTIGFGLGIAIGYKF